MSSLGISVEELVTTILYTLQDEDFVRWSRSEIDSYINEAQFFLLEADINAFTVRKEHKCDNGVLQEVPNIERILEIENVKTIDRVTMDAVRPFWRSEKSSPRPEFVIFNELDDKSFFVYPPASSNPSITLLVQVKPQTIKSDGSTMNETVIPVKHSYFHALMNFVLYRCYDKDADDAFNAQRAQQYLSAAYQALNIKTNQVVESNPNID